MPIRRLTPDSAIDEFVENLAANRARAIIQALIDIGEECIKQARLAGSYKDQTGNLRSSIGYVVVVDGDIVQMSGFETVPPKNPQKGDKYTGAEDGKAFARQLASRFPTGICLIVVAGMNYASYVSAKGYNVLDGSELLADKLVPQMLEQLGLKYKQ